MHACLVWQVAVLFLGLGSAVLLALFTVVILFFGDYNTPYLYDRATGGPPSVALGVDRTYHVFLSHLWLTGQDQCAVIKRRLVALARRTTHPPQPLCTHAHLHTHTHTTRTSHPPGSLRAASLQRGTPCA